MENPFASTHSLSENPFDSPEDNASTSYAPNYSQAERAELDARKAALDQQEARLKQQQQELASKAENLRLHGNKNWPFCMSAVASIRQVRLT